MADEQLSCTRGPASRSRCSSTGARSPSSHIPQTYLSTFESIISSYPPIFESLLLQLPTSSIITLYHTSECLRLFLQDYPTAWKNLSFRSPSPGRVSTRQNSPASDASGESTESSSKLYSLDLLLVNVVLPFGTRLKSLELDHTAITGGNLTHCVLHTRRDTLQHLSVRGCKQVSLKYHIVPFLNLFKLQKSSPQTTQRSHLALKSLYTFRCRHHRRRPYTPSSRLRKDSDSAPTHDLIQLCHELCIWTDSAWCPTLGGRCLRRKDYSSGRGTPEARVEVWVVFDRLWRSSNRLGPSEHADSGGPSVLGGELWEHAEIGYDGEPLGCGREGKGLPAHLRQSHEIFVENVSCHGCGVHIPERWEHCSIRMHCMGCRKTLCQECAFSRPLPRATNHDRDPDESFWWAPATVRNPNRMLQEIAPSANLTNGIMPDSSTPPPIKMQWCCLRPMFSNGGSIHFLGSAGRNHSINQVRAVPLPKGKGYEDPEFLPRQSNNGVPCQTADSESVETGQLPTKLGQSLESLLQVPSGNTSDPCYRNLCPECWDVSTWKAACRVCKEPFCFAHDFRGLNMRICGYRDLSTEKAIIRERSKFKDIMELWEKTTTTEDNLRDGVDSLFRKYLRNYALISDALITLEAIIPLISKSPFVNGEELSKETASLISEKYSGNPPGVSASMLKYMNSIDQSFASPSSEPEVPYEGNRNEWKGCGSFMCPTRRVLGDRRPECTAAAQQCMMCNTHVCPECLVLDPPCDCSFCKHHYRCPNCFSIQNQFCRKTEEDEEKRQQQEEHERRKAEAIRMLEEADRLASLVGEFMLTVDDATISAEGESST